MKKQYIQNLVLACIIFNLSAPIYCCASENKDTAITAAEDFFFFYFPTEKTEEMLEEIKDKFSSEIEDAPLNVQEEWADSMDNAMKEELLVMKAFYVDFFAEDFTAEEINDIVTMARLAKSPALDKFVKAHRSYKKGLKRTEKGMTKRLKQKAESLIKQK